MYSYERPQTKIPLTVLGQDVKTIFWDGKVKKELAEQMRAEYFKKPSFEEVLKQLDDIVNKKKMSKFNLVYKYFFDDVAIKTKSNKAKFSFEEFLNSDELITVFINKVFGTQQYFNNAAGDVPLFVQFMSAIRMGSSSIVCRPQNFPILKTSRIIDEYLDDTTGMNMLDTSAGWGNRLLLAASKGMNYYAFDVNHELVEKLNELGKTIQKYIKNDFVFNIFETGSQNHLQELDGKMDIFLTSPPFFVLERYNLPEQYALENYINNYDLWLEEYLSKTISNIQSYLKPSSYAFMNVKDVGFSVKENYPLVNDTEKLFNENNFETEVIDFTPGTLRKSARVKSFRNEKIVVAKLK